jgi:hypothetical protein
MIFFPRFSRFAPLPCRSNTTKLSVGSLMIPRRSPLSGPICWAETLAINPIVLKVIQHVYTISIDRL